MGQLAGKVTIVTGASAGIGRATAKLFAAQGAKIVLASRSQERLDRVAREISEEEGDCIAISTDVSEQHQVERMVQTTLEKYDRVDILVNNAGILPPPTLLAEMNERDWDRVFAVNTKSIYWIVRNAWPAMVRQGGGVIITTASVVAFRGVAEMAAYCASKAAIVMLTKVLALEGAPFGIRVNCVCPGFIDTPMNEWLGSLQPDREVWLNDMLDQIPLHRPGTPEEIARASLYLASSDSSYMTGQVLILDGGASI